MNEQEVRSYCDCGLKIFESTDVISIVWAAELALAGPAA
jgi:hypothetical protein